MYVSRSRVVQVSIRGGVRTTPETLVWDMEVHVVHDDVDIPHSVGETSHQLDISVPLTPVPVVLTLVVVRKRSASCSTAQSCAFLAPECPVHVLKWSPAASRLNCSHPQVETGKDTIVGIWARTARVKKVYQRLADQPSSLWWDRIKRGRFMSICTKWHFKFFLKHLQ